MYKCISYGQSILSYRYSLNFFIADKPLMTVQIKQNPFDDLIGCVT